MTDDEQLIDRIEATMEKSDEELQEELPPLLEEMEGRTDELVREYPKTFGQVVGRLEEADVAEFVEANPEAADQFQEIMWTGVHVLVENSPEVQEQITEDITVNFAADDCEMDGHLEVDGDEQTIRGGPGLLDDPTLEITGPANTLVGLVTGEVDPIQGFMRNEYEMDGPIQKGTRLAPIMNNLSDNVPEAEA